MHTSGNHTAANATASVCQYPLFCVVYSVSLGLGLPTNLFIIWTITSAAPDRICADIFQLNQFISELVLCTNGVFFFVSSYSVQLATTYAVSWGLLLYSRPLFQTAVCMEQYLAVVWPVRYLWFKPLRYRLACVAAVWLLSLVFTAGSVLMGFGVGFLYTTSVVLLSVLLVMGFCCLSVLKALSRPSPGAQGSATETPRNSAKTRAFKGILFNLLFNVCIYMPNMLVLMLTGSMSGEPFVKVNIALSCCFLWAGFVPAFLFLCRSRKRACVSCVSVGERFSLI